MFCYCLGSVRLFFFIWCCTFTVFISVTIFKLCILVQRYICTLCTLTSQSTKHWLLFGSTVTRCKTFYYNYNYVMDSQYSILSCLVVYRQYSPPPNQCHMSYPHDITMLFSGKDKLLYASDKFEYFHEVDMYVHGI